MLEIIQTYWLYFLVGQYPNGPLGGLVLTVLLASCALVLALPLGIAFGLARLSPWRWLRWPVTALVYAVRGVPLLMVVFWAYFFLPSVTGVKTVGPNSPSWTGATIRSAARGPLAGALR